MPALYDDMGVMLAHGRQAWADFAARQGLLFFCAARVHASPNRTHSIFRFRFYFD